MKGGVVGLVIERVSSNRMSDGEGRNNENGLRMSCINRLEG